MSKKSKFDTIFEQRREAEPEEGAEELVKPRGKRNHPDYTQVTAYIHRTLHEEVKVALIREGKRNFSTLVEELLFLWMQDKTENFPDEQRV